MKTSKEIYAKHWSEYMNEHFGSASDPYTPEDLDKDSHFPSYVEKAMEEYAREYFEAYRIKEGWDK